MFVPSNMLRNYLNADPKDMYDIVGALIGYINADPYFKTNEFDEALNYVFSHGVTKQELFSIFDNKLDFEEDSNKWTEEYYSFARVYLKDNFCQERIEHVKKVAKKIHPIVLDSKSEHEKPSMNCSQNSLVDNVKSNRGQQTNGKKQLDQHCQNAKRTIQKPVIMSAVIMLLIVMLVVMIVFFLK